MGQMTVLLRQTHPHWRGRKNEENKEQMVRIKKINVRFIHQIHALWRKKLMWFMCHES